MKTLKRQILRNSFSLSLLVFALLCWNVLFSYGQEVTPSSTARDYPSLEVYKYTMDAKGNVTTTLILDKRESGNIFDLGKKEKPVQAEMK